jgi:zinc/manganese transport system permease protein
LAVSIFFKQLLVSSILEKEALGKGLNVRALSYLYIVLLSLVVAVSVQVVGALLIFSLVVLPPAIAIKLFAAPSQAIIASPIIAVVCSVGGILLSLLTNLAASFCIVALSTLIYVLVIGAQKWLN